MGLNKSTLLRWERERRFDEAPERGPGQARRQYGLRQLREILKLKQGQIRDQYAWALSHGDEEVLLQEHQANSLRKFISGDDTGLRELRGYDKLTEESVQQLLQIALSLGPRNITAHEVLKVVWKDSNRRHS
jgi:hypothetical protein